MKSVIVLAAVLAQLVAGQATLQYDEIENAPAPIATGPPQTARHDEVAIEASLVAVVTATAAASTAAPAKFRLKREVEVDADVFKRNSRDREREKERKEREKKEKDRKDREKKEKDRKDREKKEKDRKDKKNKDKKDKDLKDKKDKVWDPKKEFCRWFPWKCKDGKPEPEKPKPGKPTPPMPGPMPPPPQDNQCTPEPLGSGPVPNPDTPEAFLTWPAFSEAALSATTPDGYEQVFQNLNAAYSGFSYITFSNLESYNVDTCGTRCNEVDGCSSFNIYFERNPTIVPGPRCPNPPSTTQIRCVLWGSAIDEEFATNTGSFRQDFQVVIAGSNAYSKPGAPIDVPDYDKPDKCPNGSIGDKGKPWWLGDKFFPGYFAPKLCKIFAEVQAKKNREDAISKGQSEYSPINGYNAFELWEDGKMIGTYCKLYTEHLPVDWCDWKGEHKLGKLWEIKNAWFYKLLKKDFGKL